MKRTGKRTIIFENKPKVISYGSVVGKKEHEGFQMNLTPTLQIAFSAKRALKKLKASCKKPPFKPRLIKRG